MVSFDVVGPLKETDYANKYILSIIDLFSRFITLHAIPNKSTNTIINCLDKTFCRFGYPEKLISGNAREFTSQALQLYAKLHTVLKKEVLIYSPFSNGLVERHNARIAKLLRFYVHYLEDQNWCQFIDTIENSLNNEVCVTLKETPAYTLLGYDTAPVIQRDTLEDKIYSDSDISLVKVRTRVNYFIREHIRSNILSQTLKRTEYHNKKRKDKSLELGDRVLIKNFRRKNKLDLQYLGPAVILSIRKNKAVVKLGPETITLNINHVIRLKDIK